MCYGERRDANIRTQHGDSILAAHGESLIDALRAAYPDAEFLIHKFKVVPRMYPHFSSCE